MLLYSGKFTGGHHESDLSQMPSFPFYVIFSEYLVFYILTMNQCFLKKAFSLDLAGCSSQAARGKGRHYANLLARSAQS